MDENSTLVWSKHYSGLVTWKESKKMLGLVNVEPYLQGYLRLVSPEDVCGKYGKYRLR